MRVLLLSLFMALGLTGPVVSAAQAQGVCEAAMTSQIDHLELEVDLHLPPLLAQMEPVLREKFERYIQIVRRSPWKTPEQSLATILSAHYAVAPNQSLADVQVPTLLIRDTTLWLGERLARHGRHPEALLLLTHVQDIAEARTIAYGQYVHLVVESLRFFSQESFLGKNLGDAAYVLKRVDELTDRMLQPSNPFLLPIFTHRSLWLRDWGGLADPVQLVDRVTLIEGMQTPLGFAEHDGDHHRTRVGNSLPQESTLVRRLGLRNSMERQGKELFPVEVLMLLDLAIFNQGLRNQLFASADSLESDRVRQSATTFLWYLDHEDGDVLPRNHNFYQGQFGRTPEHWEFLLGRVYIPRAGWGYLDRRRLRHPQTFAGFHRWFVAEYLPLVRDFLLAHPEYRSSRDLENIQRGISEILSAQQ